MALIHDVPASQGAINVIRRARQFANLAWYPRNPIAAGYQSRGAEGKKSMNAFLHAYRPRTGVIYSSSREYEKFVGFNVSLETFMTALENPRSVLYTRPLHGRGRSMYSYYGIVCSCFASYVLDLPYRTVTGNWVKWTGSDEVEMDVSRLEELRLCDVLLNKTHVAVIIDIARDENGMVQEIQVAESTLPTCTDLVFNRETFQHYWLEDNYKVYRYPHLDKVTYTPSPYSPVEGDPEMERPAENKVFMADFGNKANYELGESVEFAVFQSGWDTVKITADDGREWKLPVADGKAVFTAETVGHYTAVCLGGEGECMPVEFCVVNIVVTGDKDCYAAGEKVCVSFRNEMPDTVYTWIVNTHDHFLRLQGVLTEEEIAAGRVEIPQELAPGEYYATVMAKGEFGIYRTGKHTFRVE